MTSKQSKSVLLAQHQKLLALVRERDQLMCAYDAATLALSEDELIEHERRDWKAFARNHLAMIAMVRPLVYNDYRSRIRLLSTTWWLSNNRPTVPVPDELDDLFGASLEGWPVLEPEVNHPLHDANAVANFIAKVQADSEALAAQAPGAAPPLALVDAHALLMKQNMEELSLLFLDDEDTTQFCPA